MKKIRRSFWGYSPESIRLAECSMRQKFEDAKKELEERLLALTHTNKMLLEEIASRKEELSERSDLEKELNGLVRQSERTSPFVEMDNPESMLSRRRKSLK